MGFRIDLGHPIADVLLQRQADEAIQDDPKPSPRFLARHAFAGLMAAAKNPGASRAGSSLPHTPAGHGHRTDPTGHTGPSQVRPASADTLNEDAAAALERPAA